MNVLCKPGVVYRGGNVNNSIMGEVMFDDDKTIRLRAEGKVGLSRKYDRVCLEGVDEIEKIVTKGGKK